MGEPSRFCVYILISETTGHRYIGQTDDIERRVSEHNSKNHNPRKHTSCHVGPWRLVHQERFDTRSQAMFRERWLKSTTGRRWLNRSIGRTSPSVVAD